MPIVRIDSKLVYFAHVPKCAGSAIEMYLHGRFGKLGFLDRGYLKIPKSRQWTRSSPQHIQVEALDKLLPPCFFAARFAVVRHPVGRIVSVFRFQRDIEGKIPSDMTFSDWLDTLGHLRRRRPFHLDNHYRPMADFVPEDATVFRLENGLDPLVAWLDDLAGNADGDRHIKVSNTYDQRAAVKQIEIGAVPRITEGDRRKIETFCRSDFDRFGYTKATTE